MVDLQCIMRYFYYIYTMAKRKKTTKSKGLGDTVAKITKATGIKDVVGECKGCNKRQEKLNKLFPYKKHQRALNDAERKEWDAFVNREKQNKITPEQQILIVRLLADCLNMSVKPCATCGVDTWKTWINKINQLD